MLETIEQLLILQDRDRKISRVQQELAHIGPEREALRAKAASTQSQLDAAKGRLKHIESDRKRLELDVETKKSQIEKYANQQLLTRKNEEYRALAHEIETCKGDILKIEDQQLFLMEQAEATQKEIVHATLEANAARKLVDEQVAQLDQREGNLTKELAALQSGRAELAAAVDEISAGALRTAVEEQRRQCRRGCGSWRLRRLPHEAARADSRHLPGAEGDCQLFKLRPDSLLLAGHGSGGGGVNPPRTVIRTESFGRSALEKADILFDLLVSRQQAAFAMPTIFIQDGYRVSFYSYDMAERMHVHVFKAGHECKIWLDDLAWPSIAGSKRMKSRKSGGWFRNAAWKLSSDGLNMDAMRAKISS